MNKEIAHEVQGCNTDRIDAEACPAGARTDLGRNFNKFDVFQTVVFFLPVQEIPGTLQAIPAYSCVASIGIRL